MGNLRIRYGVLDNSIKPIFSIDILSSDLNDEMKLLKNMSKVIDLAVMLYDAKIVVQDNFVESSVDEQFPLGACSFLYFNSHEDGFNFIKELINAFE